MVLTSLVQLYPPAAVSALAVCSDIQVYVRPFADLRVHRVDSSVFVAMRLAQHMVLLYSITNRIELSLPSVHLILTPWEIRRLRHRPRANQRSYVDAH